MIIVRRFVQLTLILLGVLAFGTVGYVVIEGWSVFDALYMTVITIGTVGYGETRTLNTDGRIFTIGLIFVGIGAFTYALSSITASVVEARVFDLWGKRRMERRIEALNDHIIVCGGGDTALHIARELDQTRTPFVVIESDSTQAERLRTVANDPLFIVGDASESESLRRARITTARGLIAALPDDKDNLYTVLEARELNPSARIVTRIVNEEARQRLTKAGADAIVPMRRIGALRIASEMLRPHVVSVLDVMLREPGDIRVQEIPVCGSVAGQTLASLKLQERVGITVFAMREAGNLHHLFNPPPSRVLHDGDVLIACAEPEQLLTARQIAAGG
jgi:voltage-gated potassium channel